MPENQPKKPSFLITLLLLVFCLKGLFLLMLIPIFQGTDEPVHYATLLDQSNTGRQAGDYRSPEVTAAVLPFQFWTVAHQKENTQNFDTVPFTDSATVKDILTANTRFSLYYSVGHALNRLAGTSETATHIVLLRSFSLLFGILTVLIAFFIARKLRFSLPISFLFANLIAFQPMFSFLSTIVNIDISLFFSFTLFFFIAVDLIASGISWKNSILLLSTSILAFLSKGIGLVLIPLCFPLFVYGLAKKDILPLKKLLFYSGLTAFAASFLFFLVIPSSFLIEATKIASQSHFSSQWESLGAYLNETINIGDFADTHTSYWGNFGWLDTQISDHLLALIAVIDSVGLLGSLWYLVFGTPRSYLPEKRFLILAWVMILALQFAIRFYDWRVYDIEGRIAIGQPGRYFLPNLVPHILLVTTGLGYILTRHSNQFLRLLQTLALLMILLAFAAIFDTLIPRYFL